MCASDETQRGKASRLERLQWGNQTGRGFQQQKHFGGSKGEPDQR